jgi:predicted ATP-grasp superfamily ATP-dependent carboligase
MVEPRPSEPTVGAVILGGDFQGLGVIRSLAEHGVPVFLIDHEWGVARYSRYVKKMRYRPDLLKEEVFVQFLLKTGQEEGLEGWVLYPNNDEEVKLLSKYREELGRFYRVPVPPWDVVKQFYIKNLVTAVAERVGIPTPKEYKGLDLDEILSLEPLFPLVLKPVNKEKYYPLTRKKAVRVDDATQFKNEYQAMSALIPPEEIIVQEFVVGGTQNLFSYATLFDGKRPLAGLSAVRLRQHPMDFGKATTYAVSRHMPELEEMATRILGEIGFYGIAEVEFMKDDKDGLFKFLEINGRPWGWHTLLKAAGLNLPFLLYLNETGQEVPLLKGREGVKWVRLITDLPTVFKEITGGRMSIRDYLSSMRGKKHFAVLSTKDPLPFFAEFLLIPYLWRKRGF